MAGCLVELDLTVDTELPTLHSEAVLINLMHGVTYIFYGRISAMLCYIVLSWMLVFEQKGVS